MNKQKLVTITVDVEAARSRQARDQVDRLIWGRFGDAREVGIGRMMDVAERYGHTMSFFVDYCETYAYPGKFGRITEEIVGRGHDLQLHAHQNWLAEDFFAARGLPQPPAMLNDYSAAQAGAVLDHLIGEVRAGGGADPVAFRGGSYEYGQGFLEAMTRVGLRLSSNYNFNLAPRGAPIENLPLFTWPNGIIELPIAQLNMGRSTMRFGFDSMDCGNEALVRRYIQLFFDTFGNQVPLPAIMHSFSFLKANPATRHYEYAGEEPVQAFERFCSVLAEEGCKVVGLPEIVRQVESGALVAREMRSFEVLSCFRAQDTPLPPRTADAGVVPPAPAPALSQASVSESVCGFCGTPRSRMRPYGKRQFALCPTCGSLERQRAFLLACESWLREEFDFAGKRVLHISPSECELDYLRRCGAQVLTADARQLAGHDYQLDLCSMPEIPDASFDALVAIAVLQHCYDEHAALSEIRRVLKPGGRALLQVFHRLNRESEAAADQTQHYGEEALQSAKVGTYRTYGDRSLLRLLQKYFLVKSFPVRDPISDTYDVIFSCLRDEP